MLKATWHPVYDLVVVGRYPDDRVFPGDQRTIDIFDSNTAELVFQLQDATASGIKSVSCFKERKLWRINIKAMIAVVSHIIKRLLTGQ